MAAIFLFDHSAWQDMYVKNCSYKTSEQWNAEGSPNVPIGILYTIFGIVSEVSHDKKVVHLY